MEEAKTELDSANVKMAGFLLTVGEHAYFSVNTRSSGDLDIERDLSLDRDSDGKKV